MTGQAVWAPRKLAEKKAQLVLVNLEMVCVAEKPTKTLYKIPLAAVVQMVQEIPAAGKSVETKAQLAREMVETGCGEEVILQMTDPAVVAMALASVRPVETRERHDREKGGTVSGPSFLTSTKKMASNSLTSTNLLLSTTSTAMVFALNWVGRLLQMVS